MCKSEIIPELEDGKNSIVDVRCKDSHGRHFIVEMQVEKQESFIKRVLLNPSRVYARQLTQKDKYNLVQPVYSLNLLDHKIEDDGSKWYHHYALTNQQNSSRILDKIHVVLIELPKWKKMNKFNLEKIRDKWLLYFTQSNHFIL
jgi:predicted transposase/invertase (TIGR01784 family)